MMTDQNPQYLIDRELNANRMNGADLIRTLENAGYVVVPKIPTEEMLSGDTDVVVGCCSTCRENKIDLWAAMIVASREECRNPKSMCDHCDCWKATRAGCF